MHTIAEGAASSLPPPLNLSRLLPGKRGSKVSTTSLSPPPVEHQQLHGLILVAGEDLNEEWIQTERGMMGAAEERARGMMVSGSLCCASKQVHFGLK
jgi:hypothetical protein